SVGCAAWSLTQTTVANSTLLNNMMPIFSALGAWLVLGRTFSTRFIAGLGVAIAGVIVLGVQDLNLASDQLMGDGAALIAAILLATTLLCIERLRAEFPTSAIMAGLSLVGTVTLSPLVLTHSDTLFPPDAQSGLAVLAVALVSQVMGHGLLAYSLKQLSSGLVSVLMLTIPIMSALLAALLFGQNLGWMNGVAFVIVLSGIYLAVSQPKAQQEAE
ncbi:MAG: DMT family transporter, partial [Leptolyngbyaceae bacterium]|nr:DMT family transporter [Leptolyngbyaceae bacterium]